MSTNDPLHPYPGTMKQHNVDETPILTNRAMSDKPSAYARKNRELRDALALAGQLAMAARSVVGGHDPFTSIHLRPASIMDADLFKRLEEALDAYDNHIIHMAK